jgi:hypothetical protein
MIEWPEGESKPTKLVLTTLPRRMSKKQIVRIVKERWRTEPRTRSSRASSGWTTSKAARLRAGTITSPSS